MLSWTGRGNIPILSSAMDGEGVRRNASRRPCCIEVNAQGLNAAEASAEAALPKGPPKSPMTFWGGRSSGMIKPCRFGRARDMKLATTKGARDF